MRKLIIYLRQVFCKHDWVIEEKVLQIHKHGTHLNENILIEKNILVYMRCKKCGYHTKHKKC